MRRRLLGLLAATTAAACAEPAGPTAGNPNEGMLRDFVDGKFDSNGHPLNAKVTQAETLCVLAGPASEGAVRLTRACEGRIAGGEQRGELVASVRLRVRSAPSSGNVITAWVLGASRESLATVSLSAAQVRGSEWIDLPLRWTSTTAPVSIHIAPGAGALIDVDYVEVFLSRFGLVASPGSGVYADGDRLVFELPLGRSLDRVSVDGENIADRLPALVQQGKATRTMTSFRTLYEVPVGELLPERMSSSELELRAGSLAARMQLREEPTPCVYEGDPAGVKIVVTGFQAFPADAWHENVSGVAVRSMIPSQLRDAQVMRVVMPVEYDRAAAQLTDIIARCAPDAVLSFGQGGSAIALESTAYNLQDTGEVPGGVPDNRGVIRAAATIDPSAPSTRETLLPLDAIEDALAAIGEPAEASTDPGRYICNNVMFAGIGAMEPRGGVSGFIHLPYTAQFDDAERARWAGVVQAAVQATADTLR